MFGKSVLLTSIALAACAPVETAPKIAQKSFEPIKQACGERDGWSDPAPPAHVFGNVYMVGTCGIVSLLIVTPKGHFLIDGATAEAAPVIAENIRKAGFDPSDIRYLLSTHEHLDHVGGLAELKRITGAKFVTRAAAKTAMESGQPHPEDPQLGAIQSFEGIQVDFLIEDGETLRLGNQTLKMIATPGHAPGGTSWTWKACQGKLCNQIVYADSLSAVSADGYRFNDHPQYVSVLLGSINRIQLLPKCDILISPHPEQSQFFEWLNGEMSSDGSNGCLRYANNAFERLTDRLAKETGQ